MKNALFAALCAVGAVACAESRPAESPSTPSTVTTTETTTTSAANPRRPGQTPATTGNPSAPGSGVTTPQPPDAPRTSSGLDATRPTHDVANADASGNVTATAPAAQNPGVADNTKDATNTKVNDRDRHGALTPMDQGGGKDRDITAAIRRAVVSDSSLSFNAKNVKIITVGGKVTLRGPVKSDAERSTIEAKAKAAPGVAEVDNQLEVKK